MEPRLIEQFERLVGYRQHEVARCQKEVDDILAQRQQLVEKHFENPKAIPRDVLGVKQAELGKRLSAAEQKLSLANGNIEKAGEGLQAARRLLQHSSGSYRQVDPQTRRRWNQTFFSKLFVGPEGVKGAELTDEFGALLRDDLSKQLEAMSAQTEAHFGRGSSVRVLVELAGLEPATSWVRSRRSSN